MPKAKQAFDSEAALVDAFCETLRTDWRAKYTVYPETAGFDLLLVQDGTGIQIGIEAKLTLNAKVLRQALEGGHSDWGDGPDYRAVLVPRGGTQNDLRAIADYVGLSVIEVYNCRPGGKRPDWRISLNSPDENGHSFTLRGWHNWLPRERCKLPAYIPDVRAGIAAPVQLTQWKIKAIKLMIVLDRRGYVTRQDMKRLDISPTRWTDRYQGFLRPGDKGYVRCKATPDLKAQHPQNYEQIEADIAKWAADLESLDPNYCGPLFGEKKP